MITHIGGDEVVLIIVPRGFHTTAAAHKIDLQETALQAVIERVRAASLATHMLKTTTWNAT